MKISKKTVAALCIIVSILALITGFILYTNQKPNFSKYHSYAVVTNNGDIPLTGEQFQRIVDVYENDDTLQYDWYDSCFAGCEIKLYKTKDISGEYDYMTTGDIMDFYLVINDKAWKAWTYNKQDTARQVNAIIEEAIEQYESEQEV